MLDRLKATLKASGHSFTSSRQKVFEELAKQGPVTIASLAMRCAPEIDRATVYRSVELFEKLGILNRIWHGFKNQIELSEIFTPHHHHAMCLGCKQSIDIINPELEKQLSSIAKRHEFLALSHTIELSGYCKTCQTK